MKHPIPGKRYALSHPAIYKYIFPFVKKNRRTLTPAEELLWKHLRNRQLDGFKFRRQHAIGRYIADFVCIEAKLVVEVDGGIHLTPDQQQYDADRTQQLEEAGFRVIRFWNEEVLGHINDVLDKIRIALHAGHPSPKERGRG